MKEQRHTKERESVRAESFKKSQKQKVFVDEFGQANPHVGIGSCHPATKGKLAEPIKRKIAIDFVNSLKLILVKKFNSIFNKLEKKYGKTIALRFIDDELVDIIVEEFKMELDLKVQQVHEWFGK